MAQTPERTRELNSPLSEVYSKIGDQAEEKAAREAMKHFVTDEQGSVYALTPLVPELFAGLLKARYSRTELSAKQLLWREFVGKKEDIPWDTVESGLEALEEVFNFKRAEQVAERILLQYGDDSVFELAGAHLFFDRVSMVASKVIEDARIGISPLEKSTRYVVFDQKGSDGDYSYFKDPNIIDSEHRDLYIATMRSCFDLYAEAVGRFKQHYEEEVPLKGQTFPVIGTNDQKIYGKLDERSQKAAVIAYNASIRSKACDVARVLLPAATLTNIGEFGNARAFGYLFTKMLSMDLSELNMLASEGTRELKKILPKFFDVVDNDHGQAYQTYLQKTDEALRQRAETLLAGIQPKKADRVVLVHMDKNPEVNIAAALLYPYAQLPLEQLIRIVHSLPEAKRDEILRDSVKFRTNRRHKPPRAFEIAGYELVYDIVGNFGIYRDLQRQRTLTQQRQEYTTALGYDMPEEFAAIGLADEFKRVMESVMAAHDTIAVKFPREAQYLTTLGNYTRWYMGMNLREAFWMTELRSVPQGHFSYRTIAQDMFLQAQKRYPFLADLKPTEEEYVDMTDRRQNLERIEAMQRIQTKLAKLEES